MKSLFSMMPNFVWHSQLRVTMIYKERMTPDMSSTSFSSSSSKMVCSKERNWATMRAQTRTSLSSIPSKKSLRNCLIQFLLTKIVDFIASTGLKRSWQYLEITILITIRKLMSNYCLVTCLTRHSMVLMKLTYQNSVYKMSLSRKITWVLSICISIWIKKPSTKPVMIQIRLL